jgi:hypothetical protein
MRRGAAHPQKYTGYMEPPTRRPTQLSIFAGGESGGHSTNVLRVEKRDERADARQSGAEISI